ncbi:MAG TPA: serine protease [bacterium]|nr:serine protease [bacterium]
MGRALALALAVAAVAGPGIPPGAYGAPGSPATVNPAVFQLLTLTRADDSVVFEGTAFFIAPDGTALTNSHVVHFAHTDPARYQLIALYGSEYYSVAVVCASPLAAPPSPDGTQRTPVIGRDVAEIKLEPSRVMGAKVLQFRDGPNFSAHLTRLPAFRALRLGTDPAPGTRVRVTGYGLIQERLRVTPWEQWTTTGVITAVAKAPDGTPVFRITSVDAPRPGNSGSPVLDETDQVVGILVWASVSDFAFSAGIAGSALRAPCRSTPSPRPRGRS